MHPLSQNEKACSLEMKLRFFECGFSQALPNTLHSHSIKRLQDRDLILEDRCLTNLQQLADDLLSIINHDVASEKPLARCSATLPHIESDYSGLPDPNLNSEFAPFESEVQLKRRSVTADGPKKSGAHRAPL